MQGRFKSPSVVGERYACFQDLERNTTYYSIICSLPLLFAFVSEIEILLFASELSQALLKNQRTKQKRPYKFPPRTKESKNNVPNEF